jgi:HK97 family phage major capsid protein
MDLKVIRQRHADLKADLARLTKARADIGVKAVAEKRGLTDEERTAFTEAGPKIEATQAQLTEAASLLEAAEAANEAERQATQVTGLDPDVVAGQRAAAGGSHIEVTDRATEQPGFWGRQLQAIRSFAINGGMAHTPAADLAVLKPLMATATGMNTDVPSEGGFLVTQQRSSQVIQRAYQTGEILRRLTPMPIGPGFNGTKMPAIDETSRADNSRYGGIVSGWLGQGNTLTSGKPKFREIDLKLRKVGAFVYATDELLADSVALEAWINRYLPLELQFRIEDAVINGLGATSPLGVLNSPAVITVTRASASHVTADDMRGMINRLWAPLRSRAAFFVDQSVEPELDVLSFAIGTAGVLDPSYKPAGDGRPYATYKNIPIIPVEYCAALGTTGDIILVALDEYLFIDKGGVDQAVSLHVAFLTDEAVYRFIARVDGQPTWNAALTPKSGGSTLSCIVVLS